MCHLLCAEWVLNGMSLSFIEFAMCRAVPKSNGGHMRQSVLRWMKARVVISNAAG